MLSSGYIKKTALNAGFDLCGVARCRHLTENERFFKEWLAEGRSGGLEYLHRNLDKRFDPSKLVDGARTVVVCAVSYKNGISDGYPDGAKNKIASYACAGDYHNIIKDMLRQVFSLLKSEYPQLSGRAFVDSAPILEKQFAVEAGLGWVGRQSLLVTPQYGTFVLLGELVLTDESDIYDHPLPHSGCGECRRCIEACPAGAIGDARSIDASRCISCATVEARHRTDGASSSCDLHGWIFGCDECQSCCPYNRRAAYHRIRAFDPIFDPREITADNWLQMSNEEFSEKFAATPISRSGLDIIKRNIGK